MNEMDPAIIPNCALGSKGRREEGVVAALRFEKVGTLDVDPAATSQRSLVGRHRTFLMKYD